MASEIPNPAVHVGRERLNPLTLQTHRDKSMYTIVIVVSVDCLWSCSVFGISTTLVF